MRQTTSAFHEIVINQMPLIDVRAPVEFAAGSFPGAVNLPIMDDEERHLVGICYKEQGQQAAIDLGHQLVHGEKKSQRVAAWIELTNQYPEARLYCFRGGLRSRIARQWFSEACGRTIPRLEGGYKAFRRYLLEHLEPEWLRTQPIIIGGRTGVGKTLLLRQLQGLIDLEALANHRGSAFGRYLTPQPSQIDFENRLACELIRHEHRDEPYLLLEDEGTHIGRCYLPPRLVQFFNVDNLVLMERPLGQRVRIIFDEYVTSSQAEYCRVHGEEEGREVWLSDMIGSVGRIKKRLGGKRTQAITTLMEAGFRQQMEGGNGASHREWIEILLRDYYDPMYDYQLKKKSDKIRFTGSPEEVLGFLRSLGR